MQNSSRKSLEKRLKDLNEWDEIEMAIDEYVQIYNTELPHFGLEKINKYHAIQLRFLQTQIFNTAILKTVQSTSIIGQLLR